MKKYTEAELDEKFPDGLTCCYDCGFVYGAPGWIEAVVPNDVWELISPNENQGAGILCINCISVRCSEAGLKNVPVKLCGTEPIVVVDALPMAIRCCTCQELTHLAIPDLSPLQALGWKYDESVFGWICPKHNSST